MKLKDRLKKKSTWIIVICLIGVVVFTGRSFAAYTSQAFQRGVARNQDSETVRFASNYLQNCAYSENDTDNTDESKFAGRTLLFSEDDKKDENKTVSINLDIYNYANGNINQVSQKDIEYEIIVIFRNTSGNLEEYSVQNVDASGDSLEDFTSSVETNPSGIKFTLSQNKKMMLIGRSANVHHYVLKFPAKDLDMLKITVKAIPTNPSVTNQQMLAGVIAPCTKSTTNDFHAEGTFVYESGVLPEKYDGFNYEVSISSGKANATLTWKTDAVEIDPFFLEKLGKTMDEIRVIQTKGEVTFTMDQTLESGDYLIPFYIVDRTKIPETWESVITDEIVKFEAAEITEEQETQTDTQE